MKLTGYVSASLANDLYKIKNLIGSEKYFSIYAAMIETIDNTYQPTKTDYIIHALGDKVREEYLSELEDGDYKYIITVNPNKNEWEIWVNRANYYLYKEIITNYKPVLETSYYIVWEKQPEIEPEICNVTYEINKISEYKSEVTFKVGNVNIEINNNKYLDVEISYSIQNINNIKSLATMKNIIAVYDYKSSVLEKNPFYQALYGIPAINNTINLPVYIDENEEWKIVFDCLPNDTCSLNIDNVKINGLLPDYYYKY